MARMTREEADLFRLTAFTLGDVVEVDDSEIIGEVVGMQVQIGNEDHYLVAYHDHCGNPQRVWWPSSALADAEPEEPQANIIKFPRPTVRH